MHKIPALWVSAVVAIAACSFSGPVSAQGRAVGEDAKSIIDAPEQVTYSAWPLPAKAAAYGSIDGHHLWQYVKEQADISRHYRDAGHPQYWGRIAGTSGDFEDVQWLLGKFRQIGLSDVRSQTVALLGPQWVPASWEATAVAGARALKLTSAQPPYGTVSTDGKTLDLPLVYVGLGSKADFEGRDVRGKAVLIIQGQYNADTGPLYFSHSIATPDVLKRVKDGGAAAIFVGDLRGNNFKIIAYTTNTDVPTFFLGTNDAVAVRDMIADASAADPPHIRIRLDAAWATGQKSFLVWGTLPGATDETIYTIAHRDGWFDGGGDNASGVATMLGLAEYFAKIPQAQRRRTMIFIGVDGHHNIPNGDYGTTWLYENRAKLFSKTALFINSEHPSTALTHTGITGWDDQVSPMWWYAGGPSRPQLTKIALDAWHEFGVPLWAEPVCNLQGPQIFERPMADGRGTVTYHCRGITGDMNPFYRFLPGVIAQSSDFIYMHTDADTPADVPWTGLQAATRAYARIIDEVNKLPLNALQRPPETTPAIQTPDPQESTCTGWIEDSASFKCK